MCELDGHPRSTNELGVHDCPGCSANLRSLSAPKRLNHMGAHILHDPTLDRSIERCGFCLRPSPTCVIKLQRSNKKFRIDMVHSTCIRLEKFSYARAAESTTSTPCTNVPLLCPLCLQNKPAVWKYSFEAHLQTCHPTVDRAPYEKLYTIPSSEVKQMQAVYRSRRNVPQKRNRKPSTLKISEARSTRMALYVNLSFLRTGS